VQKTKVVFVIVFIFSLYGIFQFVIGKIRGNKIWKTKETKSCVFFYRFQCHPQESFFSKTEKVAARFYDGKHKYKIYVVPDSVSKTGKFSLVGDKLVGRSNYEISERHFMQINNLYKLKKKQNIRYKGKGNK
jgi:hypothetical protein